MTLSRPIRSTRERRFVYRPGWLVLVIVAILLLLAFSTSCATDGWQRVAHSTRVYAETSSAEGLGGTGGGHATIDTIGVSVQPFAGLETNQTRAERLLVEHEAARLQQGAAPVVVRDPEDPVFVLSSPDGGLREPDCEPLPGSGSDDIPLPGVDWVDLGMALGGLIAAIAIAWQRQRIVSVSKKLVGKTTRKD